MVLSSYKAAARGARIDQEKGSRESLQLNFWTHFHGNWVEEGKFAEIEERSGWEELSESPNHQSVRLLEA